jgi:hypothetical protein
LTFPILVQPVNGRFAATLLGAPEIRVTAPSRAEALAALEAALEQRIAQGELVAMEIGPRGISGLAGKYRDDPTLREICEDAYRQRDSEPME